MTDAHAAELTRLTIQARELVAQLQAIAHGDPTIVPESVAGELMALHSATRQLVETVQQQLASTWQFRPKRPRPSSTTIKHGVHVERFTAQGRRVAEIPSRPALSGHRRGWRR